MGPTSIQQPQWPADFSPHTAAAIFLANPAYELVQLDRMAPGEFLLIEDLGDEDSPYGVLRPRAKESLSTRTVGPDVALLFLTLQEAGGLPSYARQRLGRSADQVIGRLVLDDVLQVWHDGTFISGPRALAVLGVAPVTLGADWPSKLSVAALRYGQALRGLPEEALANRLYCFGRHPITPQLKRQFSLHEAIEAHLGLGRSGATSAALMAHWHEVAVAGTGRSSWRTWRRKHASDVRSRAAQPTYKLYVSPALETLGPAVEAVATVLGTAHGVIAFKVGNDLVGLCRPDKLVVYFQSLVDLQEGASKVESVLAGGAVHGVPFTAAITQDGLLSWGVDPHEPLRGQGPATSWRWWLAQHVAEYLCAAPIGESAGIEPWQFALQRLELIGIEPSSWTPLPSFWSQV